MNVFYTDSCPREAAITLPDKLVVKMGLEATQCLSTAHHVLDTPVEGTYLPAHKNHPVNLWIRASSQHYEWVYQHALCIFAEYTARYGREHKSEAVLRKLRQPPASLKDEGFTPPPTCMPDQYIQNSVEQSYRTYMIAEKSYYATWKRNQPDWWPM